MIAGPWNEAEPFWIFQAPEIVKICQFQNLNEPEVFKKVQLQVQEIFNICLILEFEVKRLGLL